MEIERKDRNPTPFLGMPKKRVIRGLPKAPDPNAALRSLVPGFPANVDVPEFLWGRSTAKRVPPHKFTLMLINWTDRAWRVTPPSGGNRFWLPKSRVFMWYTGRDYIVGPNSQRFSDQARGGAVYDIWIPHWLAKKNGLLEPEVTININPNQQEGIDRLRREQEADIGPHPCAGPPRMVAGPTYPTDEHWRCSHCLAVNHNSRYVCRECHRAPTVSGGL